MPVQQRHAVEQRARRDGAQHEVLHRRFGGDAGIAIEGDHGVQRQRQQLDADVHGEQVAGRRHHQHAEQRGQRQHVVLALLQAAALEVVAAVEQRQRREQEADESSAATASGSATYMPVEEHACAR